MRFIMSYSETVFRTCFCEEVNTLLLGLSTFGAYGNNRLILGRMKEGLTSAGNLCKCGLRLFTSLVRCSVFDVEFLS